MIKLKIALHDGTELIETVTEYNALEYEQKINDRESMVMAVGDSILGKGNIRMITPIRDEEVI